MIVSQFQIRNQPTTQVKTYYELLVTNLGAKAYSFSLAATTETGQFHNTAAVMVSMSSSISIKTLLPDGNKRYRTKSEFIIYPNATARVRLHPYDAANFADSPNPMESFGHIELSIPLIWQGSGEKQPQGKEPVPLLLHSYTFDWNQATGLRDYAPVTLAAGRAEQQLKPEQIFFFNTSVYNKNAVMSYIQDNLAEVNEYVVDDRLPLAGLLYLLEGARGRPEQAELINRLLADVESPFRLARPS